jgi:hypothetical protein
LRDTHERDVRGVHDPDLVEPVTGLFEAADRGGWDAVGPYALSQAEFDGGPIPCFRPRERRAFWHAKSEEVPTGVDRAGREACA